MRNAIQESHFDFYKRWGMLAKPYFKWQARQFSTWVGQRIGDVGCGLGNFVEFLREKELYLGFELDKNLAENFKLLHKAENVRLAANGDICTTGAVEEMRASQLDTIICVNVLEHINNDKCALSNMIDGISRNGHICIIVPAFPWLYGSLDELDGHCRRYTKKDLLRLIKDKNVEVIKCYYLNFLGGLGWLIKGRIIREKRHGNENYTIINKLLPLISFVERIIKPPFGLSLVMVLKKK
jgi:2-polyprenyl-3-methyl-5-hydroxy-6-metoxy-1,4-benzoquinol methylase